MKNIKTREELNEADNDGSRDMEFTASRLASGEHVQPDQIVLGAEELTIRSPHLLGGEEETVLYGEVTGVDIDSPELIGFSTLIIYSRGTNIKIHGFTKGKAETIKRIIEERKDKSSEAEKEDK